MTKIKDLLKKYVFLIAILFVGCNADLKTKDWAVNKLKFHSEITIIPNFFELRYIENSAVAFSLLHQVPYEIRLPLIFTLTSAAMLFIIILIWLWREKKFSDLLPLILILSGAIGNVYDRYCNGYVIDFLHLHYRYQYSFPIFNVADVLVFLGTALLFLQYWRQKKAISELS